MQYYDYTIIYAEDESSFVKKVNSALSQGYTLVGGLNTQPLTTFIGQTRSCVESWAYRQAIAKIKQ